MASKIGWTIKVHRKLASIWKSLVKLLGSHRFISPSCLFIHPSICLSIYNQNSSHNKICRVGTSCSLTTQVVSMRPCSMLAGGFFHLTLIMNLYLKVFHQPSNLYVVNLPPQFLYNINYVDLWVRLPFLSSIEHSLLILNERMLRFQLVNSLPPFFSWSIDKIGLAAFYWRICGYRIGWE